MGLSAGFSQGLFGQINSNIDTKRKQTIALQNMEKTGEMERSKTLYMAKLEEQKKLKEEYRLRNKDQYWNKDGTITQQGQIAYAVFDHGSMMTDGGAATQNKLMGLYSGETRGNLKEPGSLESVEYGTSTKVDPRNPNKTKLANSIAQEMASVSNETPLVPAGEEAQPAPLPGNAVNEGVPGEAPVDVSSGGAPVSTSSSEFFPSAALAPKDLISAEIEEGGKKYKVWKQPGSDTEVNRIEMGSVDPDTTNHNFVHVLGADGKIDTTKAYSFSLRDGVPSIRKGGEWVEAGNVIPADTRAAFGKPADLEAFKLNTDEESKVSNISIARKQMKDLTSIATLEDRGPLRYAQVLVNSFQENLAALHISGDPGKSVQEMIAAHNEYYGASDLANKGDLLITPERERDIILAMQSDTTDVQDAAFSKGQIDTIRTMLPLLVIKAITGGTRPTQAQVDSVTAVLNEPPGQASAAAISTLRGIMDFSERSIFSQKYTEDHTPPEYSQAGWFFTGELERSPNGTINYQLYNEDQDKTVYFPVRSQPSIEKINKRASLVK